MIKRTPSLIALAYGCMLASLSANLAAQGGSVVRLLDIPSNHSAPAEMRAAHGYIIVIDRAASAFPGPGDDKVSVIEPSGAEVFTRSPGQDIPDARVVALEDATIDRDGTLVVAVQVWNAQGTGAAALVVYDIATARTLRVIRTNPVICLKVRFDSEHGVWCLGPDADAAKAGRDDYALLWRYSTTGELLKRALPRSSLPGGRNPWSRFAALTTDGATLSVWLPTVRTFVEVSPARTRIEALPAIPATVPNEQEDFIRMQGQEPIVMAVVRGTPSDRSSLYRGFFQFDRARQAWTRLKAWPELPVGVWPIGVESGQVVLWDRYQRAVVRLADR